MKRLLGIAIIAFFLLTVPAHAESVTILSAKTVTGTSDSFRPPVGRGVDQTAYRTFQVALSGTGAVTATVAIECSNDGINWETAITFSLSGTSSAHDGNYYVNSWTYTRANVTAISGTSAAVTVIGGW